MTSSEMMVHHTVYHQRPGHQAGGIVHRYSRLLASDDPPFEMPCLVLTEEWQPLPCGHVEQVERVVIRNDEGGFSHVIPTDEERELMSRKVVEVSLRGRQFLPDFLVHPGCSESITPGSPNPKSLYIRARRGRITCWLMVVPR